MLDYIPLTAAAGRRMATAELRSLATTRMRDLGYAYVGNEFAPAGTSLRFDVIGVAKYTRQVRIYEVKSSRSDFLCDAKWERYLDYCTHFSFVAPAGAIFGWELRRGVGLVEYGAPAFERMRRARRFGFTILREDCLRATRPARRLRDSVASAEWIALLETIALGSRAGYDDATFAGGAGI
ncbi:MAG: MmcB family DNA repair protein [Candidatus Eremiobacteraeota bacterium]|nr:MmcB family DNA repair protein [Candidatus Eremiobacteraeota bacterium]